MARYPMGRPQLDRRYEDYGGLALEDIVGHEAGSEYGGDIPGYDPEGLVIPEEQEIAAAVDVPDAQPKGFMENLANVFGNSPIKTQGEGLGGLISAIAGGVANYHIGKAGKQLEGRKKEAEGQRKYELEQRGKAEEGRRLFQRQALIERIKAGLKKPDSETATVDVGGVKVPVTTELGQRVVGERAGIGPKANPNEARLAAAAERSASAAERADRQATFSNESRLVNDYAADEAVKGYKNVRSNLKAAEASRGLKTGFGDKAMIFAYMRALEPENPNVVREGENLDARNAVGLVEKLKNLPEQYFSGNNLSELGRVRLLEQMRASLKSRRRQFDDANARFRKRAKGGGVDESVFLTEFPEDTFEGGSSSSSWWDQNKPGGK